MATEAPPAVPFAELVTPSVKPQEISFTLPKALHTTAHVHLNFLGHCAMVFLATSSPGDSGGSIKPMGSFVYAMPDVSTLSAKFGILCHISSKGNAIFSCHITWTGGGIVIWNTSRISLPCSIRSGICCNLPHTTQPQAPIRQETCAKRISPNLIIGIS